MVPDQCKVLPNPVGSAPGLQFSGKQAVFFALPGVPYEMKRIFADSIVPILQKSSPTALYRRVMRTFAVPESRLFERLGRLEGVDEKVQVSFLPNLGGGRHCAAFS